MASGSWWVIRYTLIGQPSTYQYFQGTQAAAKALAGKAVDGSLTGPFSSKADAQAAVKTGNVTPPDTGQLNPLGAITSTADAIARMAAAFTGFFSALEDGSLWISLAWITLGAALLLAGIVLWMKKADLIPKGLPVPIPV